MSELSLVGVYQIVSPQGSRYIGATAKSFEERWSAHRSDFRLGKTKCLGLLRAFQKYGLEGMSWEVLEAVDQASLESIWLRERDWWIHFKDSGVNLYNGCPTGTGSVLHTTKTRQRISEGLSKQYASKGILPRKGAVCSHCLLFVESMDREGSYCSWNCYLEARGLTGRPDAEMLNEMYWVKSMTLEEIGLIFSVSGEAVKKWLIKFDIPRRTRKQQQQRLLLKK